LGEPDESSLRRGEPLAPGFRIRERTAIPSGNMDGTTTMKVRAALAAIALLALGGSISSLSAAEGADSVLETAPGEIVDPALPRFIPLEGPVVVAEELATVQAIPEADVTDEGDVIGAGVASWYGREFAGRKTASGERFNPSDYTAAHRTLPFGSRVRVTNAAGQSVVVRINDRGPFHGGRVIDLSQAAAADLGIVRAGSGRVELALLD
jgi:rare lipoprotein A